MKETIERLRLARVRLLNIDASAGHRADLHKVARDIQTSIAELEKVQAMTEALAPAFMSMDNAVRKAFHAQVKAQAQKSGEQAGEVPAPYVRKTCTCGRVDVTSALTGGHVKHVRGLTDPQCPFHGGTADV